MADIFKITPAIRQLAQGAIDSMIDQLGKTCRLVFDRPQEVCPNCFFDPRSKASAGTYNGTGPVPFSRPPCPVCHGTGYIGQSETTRDIILLIDWQPKIWQFVDTTQLKTPQAMLQAKGYISDMPAVLQCKYMIVDPSDALYETNRFVLWGEPTPSGNIVVNRYFVTLWKRWGS